ncbi:hypothetical protein [Legionella waltersii]|uniref:Uncharacterized protein n=1 Tax=Legionella waltersii TaxID=66969 RepID=A0A0W1AMF1_9GAMM|nr:hypothetical protein [Legionella waltersii]KTD82486.1 hypothetical protein Lwal_0963 [Legionella waltersii]SNV07082.1 Uncharacterised protein [Legionella waltersii]
MFTTLENSINSLRKAIRDGILPTETNPVVQTAAEMLEELRAKSTEMTDAQIKEMHDVIMVGALIFAIRRCEHRLYIASYPERYKVNVDSRVFSMDVLQIARLDYTESNQVKILILGSTLLFNDKHKGLFNPDDFSPDGFIGCALHPWISKHMEEYNEHYQVKNTYPIGNYSSSSIIKQLINASPTDISKFKEKVTHHNHYYNTHLNIDKELHALNRVHQEAEFANSNGGDLSLSAESALALLKLAPGVRTWLLQGYQLIGNPIPPHVFEEINAYLLNLEPSQARQVQQHANYSLYLNTKSSLPFWKKIPLMMDDIYEKKLKERLQHIEAPPR